MLWGFVVGGVIGGGLFGCNEEKKEENPKKNVTPTCWYVCTARLQWVNGAFNCVVNHTIARAFNSGA